MIILLVATRGETITSVVEAEIGLEIYMKTHSFLSNHISIDRKGC